MKNYFFLHFLIIILFFPFSNHLFAQCDINFDVPNAGGIYPDTLFNAQGCEFYEETITFVLPRDTTVEIIPGQEVTIPFNSFTVANIAGLPEGMDWICNKDTVGCVYDVSPENTSPDTLGCVRIFGTPETPGFYPIAVEIIANLPGLGDQPAQFDISLTVTPCVVNSDCYTFELSDICTPSTLSLSNNVMSQGQAGFSYVWEIEGPNGYSFRSEDENPNAHILEEGGSYVIAYSAQVDTVGDVITEAIIEAADCRDLIDAGDIYWILKDSAGNEFFNTSASPLNNASNDVPIVTNLTDTVLPEGVYEFQVWDNDDNIFDRNDDGCADSNDESAVSFSIPLPDSLMSGDTLKLTNQGLSVSLIFARPISFFSCTDTFSLSASPTTPEIAFSGDLVICENDSTVLETTSSDSLQWFRDGEPLGIGSVNRLVVTEPGVYHVQAIKPITLCTATSQEVEVTQVIVPAPEIEFSRDDSTLLIVNPNIDYVYEWFKAGESIGMGVSLDIDASGDFTAIAIDPGSGCNSGESETLNAIVLDREIEIVQDWKVYPNPTNGLVTLDLRLFQPQRIQLNISDLYGRVVYQHKSQHILSELNKEISLAHLSKGIYLLNITLGDVVLYKKIVLR